MACLTKAQTNGFTSIAFPALGTGNLQFPDAVVAQKMYDTAIKFSDNNPKSCLRTVIFVVFPASKSTVKVCEYSVHLPKYIMLYLSQVFLST